MRSLMSEHTKGTAPEAASDDEIAAAFMAIFGDPDLAVNPQKLHRKFREQGAAARMGPMVLLNTRAAVSDALHRPEAFSSGMDSAMLGNTRPLIPMQVDPPGHARYRRLLDPLFAPKRVQELEPSLVTLINELIDGFAGQGGCDFTEQFAKPVPGLMFLELLGLPRADLDGLVRFKDDIVHPPREDPAETDRVQKAAGQELYGYFGAALAAHRAAPDGRLISELLGTGLTDDEIVDICYLILLAGLDTVTDTLTLSFVYLARHPMNRAQIAADPALIPAAAEELLRWESPIPGVPRLVVQDTEIAGCPVHPGDIVFVGFGAANTDEAGLADAYTVRFDRRTNPHLAFGGGIHRCLGSHLARLQVRTAMREWHRRIPDYRIPDGTELSYTSGLRSVANLPLAWS
jgi:cytochrome P450